MFFVGLLFSLVMGITLGLVGSGGSILTVPILFYFFHFDALMATTASLFVVGTTALLGAFMNARKSAVNFRAGISFAVPSSIGVLVARKFILPSIPLQIPLWNSIVLEKNQLILISFSILMIFASISMIRSKPIALIDTATIGYFRMLFSGFFIGIITGFVGAGGGFLIIPSLIFFLRIPMRVAVGTSLAIISVNSLFGFAISKGVTSDAWPITLTVAGLGILGIIVGHRFSHKVSEGNLKRIFGYLVLGLGIFMIIDRTF